MKLEFSAGGIIYKKHPSASPTKSRLSTLGRSSGQEKVYVLLGKHSYHKGWVFPKGLIDDGEKEEEAAVREVREETGADGVIEKALMPVTYTYSWNKEKRKKTVHYFIMKYVGGDITDHDTEMEDVRWFELKKAIKILAFKGEKKFLEKNIPEIIKLANL